MKQPTLKQTTRILSEEIRMYRESYREPLNKNRITDKGALRTIAGLKRAKKCVESQIARTS